jgi:hypothetical protein
LRALTRPDGEWLPDLPLVVRAHVPSQRGQVGSLMRIIRLDIRTTHLDWAIAPRVRTGS